MLELESVSFYFYTYLLDREKNLLSVSCIQVNF